MLDGDLLHVAHAHPGIDGAKAALAEHLSDLVGLLEGETGGVFPTGGAGFVSSPSLLCQVIKIFFTFILKMDIYQILGT